MHERIRDKLLARWGSAVARHPWPTLAVCLLLAAAAIVLTANRLEFRSDRSDLIDPALGWNRLYAQYKTHYDRWDDLIVCLDGPAGDPTIDALARTIAESLRKSDRVVAADAGFPASAAGPRLYRAAPPDVFDDTIDTLAIAQRFVTAPDALSGLAAALGTLRAETTPDETTLETLESWLAPYLASLRGEPPVFPVPTEMADRWTPFVSVTGSGRLRFVQVQMKDVAGGVDDVAASLAWLRQEVGAIVAGRPDVDIEWGVTGVPAIEADETQQSIRDSTLASIVAFTLITLIMLAVFRGVVVPLLAAGALLVGMAWSFGWLVLAVGHLQLLSVVFSVILLGLGIDFALHLVARLELIQDEHDALPDAISRVFRGIGPGLLTGAITTAAAFGVTALTKFKGMAEMGLIAGGGILLCLVAVLCVLPAGLAATGRWKKVIRHRPGGESAHFAHGRLDTVDFHPRTTLLVGGLIVALLLWPASRVQYDPNILNLQAPGVESVAWEHRSVDDDARSVWSAIVETTPEEAPALIEALRRSEQVSGVSGIGVLFPPDLTERDRQIAAIRAISPSPPADARPEALRDQMAAVRLGLQVAGRGTPPDTRARLTDLDQRLAESIIAFDTAEPAERIRRRATLERTFAELQGAAAPRVAEALAPAVPNPGDLPEVLRAQWTRDGHWLLLVHPAPDPRGRSILDPDRLGVFVRELQSIAPNVLGPPVQIYESSRLITREYVKAAVYAVAAILVLLLLDFRSLADTLCAMLPVTVGFVGAFGLMGLVDVPLNFANIIVLPLIFGIGVDAGVHLVHRWRLEPWGRPAGLSGGTGRGVTLTLVTTMIGFGSMLLAEHRGIRSLGIVMVAGLGVTLAACLLLLPPVLRLRTPPWTETS